MTCPSCQTPTHGKPFCPFCGKIVPRAPGATHFDLFALPPKHALDVAPLEKQYRELSLKLHPDRWAQAEPKEKRLSLEWTTALNDAVKVLRDPVRRAFYLLKLQGVDLDREDQGHQKGMPLEFLEEVMELREALGDLRGSKDLAGARKMAAEVEQKKEAALAEGVRFLDGGETKNASHSLARVRYFQRFLDEVEAFEEEGL